MSSKGVANTSSIVGRVQRRSSLAPLRKFCILAVGNIQKVTLLALLLDLARVGANVCSEESPPLHDRVV